MFIRGEALNIAFVFTNHNQFCFVVLESIRQNSTHSFIMKTSNKQQFRKILINHSLYIAFKDVRNLYKKCTTKSYCFFVNDATLASDKFLHRRNDLQIILKVIIMTDDKLRDEKTIIQCY